ncbi:hypothetical protein HY480_02045 [Candidatus Uhrbacteria bacterium]|nr:hypothetical protein [Candidatus Uhrbacteria bacterium]
MHRSLLIAAFVIVVLLPSAVFARAFDVGITRAGITFVPAPFFIGDHVRVYATVENVGERDVDGSVFFSENGTAIGTPQPFSARARGANEEVWVGWQPATAGDRQITVRVVANPDTRDEDLTNNEMFASVFVDRDANGNRIGDSTEPPPPPPPPPTVSSGSGSASPPPVRAPAPSSGALVSAPATTKTAAGAAVAQPAATKTVTQRAPMTAPSRQPQATSPIAPTVPPAPPAEEPSVSDDLRQLLGGSASRTSSTLTWVAGIVALVCAGAVATLIIRRKRRRGEPWDRT